MDKINQLENSLLGKLTEKQLEARKHDFKKEQTIQGSEIITLNSLPSQLRKQDEQGDFANFCQNWVGIGDLIATSISLSETGKYQILSNNTGGIYLSMDYGVTFVPINDELHLNTYTNVVISLDGSHLIASGDTNTIISKDFGNTWDTLPLLAAYSIYISCDNKLQYITNNEGIYISKDYGLSFILLNSYYNMISCSSNCQHVSGYIKDTPTKINYSNDYGVTFKESDSPLKIWKSIKSSITGQYQTAITSDSLIYVSSNYGINWQLSTTLYEDLIILSISGSGKYQLLVSNYLYISTDYGISWRANEIENISTISLSSNGKCAILSNNSGIFSSTIVDNYIKEYGMSTFTPLDKSTFATNWTESSTAVKVSISKYGRYQSMITDKILVSNNYGLSFDTIDISKTWRSIKISDSGKYQIAIEDNIWRSDDYGQTFNIVTLLDEQITYYISIETPPMNEIAISENGKYQSICCNNGLILTSNDYGYTWLFLLVGQGNLTSITMSKNGKYQSSCGYGSVIYSKTYGLAWKESNLSSEGILWKSISCSKCGQYQTLCRYNNNILVSEDYGLNWIGSISGERDWCLVVITYDENVQLAFVYGGEIYISNNFGHTWNSCYNTYSNYISCAISDTLQYINVVTDTKLLISKIDGNFPGLINIPTKYNINDNCVVLISGSNQNIYSYETNHTNSFNILSSDLDDSSSVSYVILSYGETIN